MTPGRRPAPGVFCFWAGDAPFPSAQGEQVRIFLLLVFGALGTLARYLLQGVIQTRVGGTFPSGTLVVNLIGCFLIGGIGEYALLHLSFPPEWRIGITVGFIGGFTTFSTYCWETVRMLQDGEWRNGTIYVLASLIGGLICVIFGMRIAERIS
jgi:fluoride exporter